MESCLDHKCLCEGLCSVSDRCALKNELFSPYTKSVVLLVRMSPKDKREKKVIELLQAIKPPKVSGAQITRYYALKKKDGVDLDSDKVTKRERGFHEKFMRIQTDKMRRKTLHLLRTDESRQKKLAKKKKVSLVREYLESQKIVVQNLNEQQRRMAYKRAANFAAWHSDGVD